MKENRRISVLAGIAASLALPSRDLDGSHQALTRPEHASPSGSREDHAGKEIAACATHSH